jgi:hypothetical protein
MNNMTTPEHLHLALNHLPFLGAGFALIPLAIGFFTKNKNAVLSGLLIAVISGWMTPFVMETGESAYERYKEGPIAQFLDPQAEKFLEEHEHRAEKWSKVMYASALVSSLCLGMLMWKPAWLRILSSVAAFFCVASLVSGVWIAESGGPIRRPDFRADQNSVPSISAGPKDGDHATND